MPEHTGTATVHPFLYEHAAELGVDLSQCHHSHEAVPPKEANFTFAFIANPFRRVLSSAAYQGVISGGKKMLHEERSVQVAAFRRWVMRSLCNKNNHNVPKCIWQQATALQRFPRPHLLGRTSHLSDGFAEVLHVLGYPPTLFKGFTAVHCSATCTGPLLDRGAGRPGTDPRVHILRSNQTFETLANASAKASVQWFDAETSARVNYLFNLDFNTFGFSRDPAHMWDHRGDATLFDPNRCRIVANPRARREYEVQCADSNTSGSDQTPAAATTSYFRMHAAH